MFDAFKTLPLALSEGISKWKTVHAGSGTRTVDSFITVLNGGTQTVNLPASGNPFCVLVITGGATVTVNGTWLESTPVATDGIVFCQRADGVWYATDAGAVALATP